MKKILSKIDRVGSQLDGLSYGDRFEITLKPKAEKAAADKITVGKKYAIEVKDYMTQPATTTFDFMDKWNKGKPMPCTCMYGKAVQETRGMIYMQLQAENDLQWQGWVIKSAIKEWEEM